MNIAMLIETDAPGGAERMVAQLSMELERRGHSVVVFVPPRGDGWLGRQLAGSGVGIDHFWLDRPFDPGCARELAGSLQSHEIDIAHSHEFSMAFYGAWASHRISIPHVITMHGRVYWADRVRRRMALRTAAIASDAFVSVSRELRQQMARDLWLRRERIGFIPNGVRIDPVVESSLRDELHLAPHERLIVSVGSLYPVKGHRYLIDAVARLRARHPHVHLAIAGGGFLEAELREHGDAIGLGPNLHLLGLRPDVANVLAGGDVFVLPSLAEGLPLALLEAMLAGRPIVATAVGDNSAVLENGTCGITVPPGDAEALAGGIEQLLDDPAQASALATAARKVAEAEYRLELMTERYETLYRELLRNRNQQQGATLTAALAG